MEYKDGGRKEGGREVIGTSGREEKKRIKTHTLYIQLHYNYVA